MDHLLSPQGNSHVWIMGSEKLSGILKIISPQPPHRYAIK